MDIAAIQKNLSQLQLDGWLIYDFRKANDLACRLLKIPEEQMLTRRFFYWIPQKGNPVKLVHAIEQHVLDHLPGDRRTYHRWQQLESRLSELLNGARRVAMEYSPKNALPYLSKVDGGTLDLVRSFGPEVVSSGSLLQAASSVMTEAQVASHFEAADILDRTVAEAWDHIRDHLSVGKKLTDYDVQQFILQRFSDADCATSGAPIVAVNGDSADPHYVPDRDHQVVIKEGDFVLIDLWCKRREPNAIYGDICRVGVVGRPTEKQNMIFHIVQQAQQAALDLIRERCAAKQSVRGYEADQAARDVIEAAGYGEFFTHRTGHNIFVNDHGDGAHLDNFETKDDRILLPGTCFSIEPGIYLPEEFGVRLEYDVYIDHALKVHVTGGTQSSIELLSEVANT